MSLKLAQSPASQIERDRERSPYSDALLHKSKPSGICFCPEPAPLAALQLPSSLIKQNMQSNTSMEEDERHRERE